MSYFSVLFSVLFHSWPQQYIQIQIVFQRLPHPIRWWSTEGYFKKCKEKWKLKITYWNPFFFIICISHTLHSPWTRPGLVTALINRMQGSDATQFPGQGQSVLQLRPWTPVEQSQVLPTVPSPDSWPTGSVSTINNITALVTEKFWMLLCILVKFY